MQHGAGGYCGFLNIWLLPQGWEFNSWGCNFFFISKDAITVLYSCETQFCSASLSAYIDFSDSALSTLISAEHSDQRWTDLSGPSLSPFPANLAGEGGKLTLISADQNMWGRDKTSSQCTECTSCYIHTFEWTLIPLDFSSIPVPFLRIPEDSWGFLQEWEGHCKVLDSRCCCYFW